VSLVAYVLKRPYTVFAALLLIVLLGAGAATRMPVDIFPEIDIPVVAVVWSYRGMGPQDMQNRILTLHERSLASLVDDISRIEATSYEGIGIEKIYLHQGADVTRAITQLASSALIVLKYMPRNITPPLVLRYGATDVPIIDLSLASNSLSDTALNDLGQNVIRPDLAYVHGAEVPQPYGGKPREIMIDLDQQALASRGLSPTDVANALHVQNVIQPAGDAKMGDLDYVLAMNNSPDALAAIDDFPVKEVGGKTVFVRDVAHVHDGYQIQTNSVSVNGTPGALMTILKTGGVSTLAVIDGVKDALPHIEKLLPKGVTVKALFDQSIFIKAALNSVLLAGAMAAALTALMILVFLGNWRLTLIILASIPLSIVTAVVVMYIGGQTLNTMTLGGFALSVGILVDNATVVIENIERHVRQREPLTTAIVNGAAEVATPTVLSTLCICTVFVPVFLLEGTAKYLFSPLSLSVCVALVASLALSFTLVPVLFKYLMRTTKEAHIEERDLDRPLPNHNIFNRFHHGFERGFDRFRGGYSEAVAWASSRPLPTIAFFAVLMLCSLALFPALGRDFFPDVDAGQMLLHVRAPPGTRIEKTQEYFARVEAAIRRIVGNNQIEVMLDNIGLPYSGINRALSNSATVGPMDGDVLISLKPNHSPTAGHVADLRRELPRLFPELTFFFEPADIVDQVLNFGRPAPIDIRISGPDNNQAYALSEKITRDLNAVPGVVDSHIFQVPNTPALTANIDRTMAEQFGLDEESAANDMLVTTTSSIQTAPNFWVDPKTGVSYPLVVQLPTYRLDSAQDLWRMPVTAAPGGRGQLLMNVAKFGRGTVPMAISQLNIRPVFDVEANVQGTDLQSAADGVSSVIDADRPPASSAMTVTVSGEVETMQESYSGLFGGMAVAVILVYLFLVINFQSWIDPIIVLIAVPFALGGVMWMLYLTGTHLSVPALMGTLMCIGLTTANSILVVTFANQRLAVGDDSATAAIAAGYTRLRPVLMTAGAMILGMIPMALGIGEGGEQNAPLGCAVIGGLLFATFATLIFVPTIYRLLRRQPSVSPAPLGGNRVAEA
jgi:multidrug efflux pump subunit AcrB